MRTDPNSLHDLLDDVMPTTNKYGGPNRATLIAMVQRERARRQRVRAASAVAAIALLALLVLWPSAPANEPGVVDSRLPMKIQEVNDEQLMALLQGTPSALMAWPDGRRTLLVVAH